MPNSHFDLFKILCCRILSDGAQTDIVAASLPAPDTNTMMAMSKREQKLRSSPSCQRALTLPLSSRQEISRQIRLRVVREFNLPDGVADLLENSSCYCIDDDQTNINAAQSTENLNNDMDDDEEITAPPSPATLQTDPNNSSQQLNSCFDQNLTFPRQQHISNYTQTIGSTNSVRRHDLPALITER